MTNVHFAAVEMDGGNQSVFVTTNIENNPLVNFVRRWKSHAQFCKTLKLALLNDLKPSQKGCLAVWVFFPELDQGFAGNNVHGRILSQIEIFIKDISKIASPPPQSTKTDLRDTGQYSAPARS